MGLRGEDGGNFGNKWVYISWHAHLYNYGTYNIIIQFIDFIELYNYITYGIYIFIEFLILRFISWEGVLWTEKIVMLSIFFVSSSKENASEWVVWGDILEIVSNLSPSLSEWSLFLIRLFHFWHRVKSETLFINVYTYAFGMCNKFRNWTACGGKTPLRGYKPTRSSVHKGRVVHRLTLFLK